MAIITNVSNTRRSRSSDVARIAVPSEHLGKYRGVLASLVAIRGNDIPSGTPEEIARGFRVQLTRVERGCRCRAVGEIIVRRRRPCVC